MTSATHTTTITVALNNNPVVFHVHKATGLEIKDTAIAQGVKIQRDYALFLERGNSPLKPVADDEVVTLNDAARFRATTTDDNS